MEERSSGRIRINKAVFIRAAILLVSLIAACAGCSEQSEQGERRELPEVALSQAPQPVPVTHYWAAPKSSKVVLLVLSPINSTGEELEINETSKRVKVYMRAQAPNPVAEILTYRVELTLKSPIGNRPLVGNTGPEPERITKEPSHKSPTLTPSKITRK